MQAAAGTAMRQARWTGIAAVLIIIAIGNALGSFMLRVLGRAFRRARHLMSALGRLGDRDRLLGQLRSTAAVLGGVAGELRSAAGRAATVGTQQSSAVTETSATIEQLAATAGASTATMLEDSIQATLQQKTAADQVDGAIQQIREAA